MLASTHTSLTGNELDKPMAIQSPSLQNFVNKLREAFRRGTEHRCVDEKEVNEIFELFTHSSEENERIGLDLIQPYCYVDPTKNYTRNLITENEHFSLMVLCWNPHAKSCIHAHGGMLFYSLLTI
jgi:hypothetical protein